MPIDIIIKGDNLPGMSYTRTRVGRKRRHNLFVRRNAHAHNSQGEWMVDYCFTPSDKQSLLTKIIYALGFGKDCRILIPGIGTSHLAFEFVVRHRFSNVTVFDISPNALKYQQKLNTQVAEPASKFVILAKDLQVPSPGDHKLGKFDVVIDSSVTDVFVANGGASKAQHVLRSYLSTRSALIMLSMNHRPIVKYMKQYNNFCYSCLKQFSGSQRNPRCVRRDVSVFLGLLGIEHEYIILPLHPLMVQQRNVEDTNLLRQNKFWLLNPRPCDLVYVNPLIND